MKVYVIMLHEITRTKNQINISEFGSLVQVYLNKDAAIRRADKLNKQTWSMYVVHTKQVNPNWN